MKSCWHTNQVRNINLTLEPNIFKISLKSGMKLAEQNFFSSHASEEGNKIFMISEFDLHDYYQDTRHQR